MSECIYYSYASHMTVTEILLSAVTYQYIKSLHKVLLLLSIFGTTHFIVSNHKVHQNSYKITLKHHVNGSPNSRIHQIQYIQRYGSILAHCAISPIISTSLASIICQTYLVPEYALFCVCNPFPALSASITDILSEQKINKIHSCRYTAH